MPTWTEGRIGKYRPVMMRCKCSSTLNVWRNGYHWGLIISHCWWSGIFDWCSLSKEPWHSQLPPAAGCLLLSTGHVPVAEAAGRKERMLMAHQQFFTTHCLETSSPSWAVWGKTGETEQLRWGKCSLPPPFLPVFLPLYFLLLFTLPSSFKILK